MPFSTDAFRQDSALALSVINCASNSLTLPFSLCPSRKDLYSAMDWLSLYCLTCSSRLTFSSSAFLSLPSNIWTLAYSSSLNWWLTELKTSLFFADSITDMFSLSMEMVSVSVFTSISYFLQRIVNYSSCTSYWLLCAALRSSLMIASLRSSSIESISSRMRRAQDQRGSTGGQDLASIDRRTCISLDPQRNGIFGEEGFIEFSLKIQVNQAPPQIGTTMYSFIQMRRRSQQVVVEQHPLDMIKDKIICAYCHMFHLKEEMKDGLCPKMHQHAVELQRKNGLACDACGGEGSFVKVVETKMMESSKRFEQRLKQWKKEKGSGDMPIQRTIKEERHTAEVVCADCRGRGFISRMLEVVCERNIFLKYEQMAINPAWQVRHMKSRQAQEAFHCSICLTDCQIGQKSFKLKCSHQFHYSCLFRWLKMNERCPICRSIDPFIDVKCAEVDAEEVDSFVFAHHSREMALLNAIQPQNNQYQDDEDW